MTDFREIMQNENFQRLAAFLRVASRPDWLTAHPASKFGFCFGNFVRHAQSYHPDLRQNLIGDYAGMTSNAVEADIRLYPYVTTSALEWFVGLIDNEDRQFVGAVLILLLAVSACEDTVLTPAEAAKQTGTSESYWRNHAAAGNIPGAQKKGKQWLIPRAWIKYAQL